MISKKKKKKILRILKTTTRFDEPAKGFLAKSTPTAPNNKQIVIFFRFTNRLVCATQLI